MDARPYQLEAERAIFNEWASGNNRTLLVLPTGTGKTVVFANVAKQCVQNGERVLVLAHRGELLEQAADKILKFTGLMCATEKAEESCLGSWYRITVGSVQSLQREKRLEQFDSGYFDAIIIDEAHHCLSDGYQRVLEHFGDAHVLGVTATPDRGDMRNLGSYFDSLAYEYTLPQAIKDGYLAPIKALTIPLNLDLTGVAMQNGDFKAADIDNALDPYLYQIADEMIKNCKERKTVVFLPLIKTSQKFRDILNERGFKAAEVNGGSQNRAEIIEAFERGEYNVLCNSMLLTEGWDCPAVDCVIVLRPTKVRSLYSQMVGRGTRLAPGKKDLLLLDFLWHTERHELCHPAHLICESEEVAKKMTENIEAAGCPVDIEAAEQQAESDVVAQREETLAAQLKEMRKRKRKLVDPLQYEMSISAQDLSSYVPAFGWECAPPTEKQIKTLEKLGIFPDAIENAGKAKLLLDRLSKRREEGLTTPKQIAMMFLGITADRKVICLDERVYNNRDISEPIAPSDTVRNYVDFLERNRAEWGLARNVFIDSADQATMTELLKYRRNNACLYSFNNAYKATKIIDRINLQLGWLHTGHYLVCDHCKNHIAELELYSWQQDKDNQPEDRNDHTINASQYGWLPYVKQIGAVAGG